MFFPAQDLSQPIFYDFLTSWSPKNPLKHQYLVLKILNDLEFSPAANRCQALQSSGGSFYDSVDQADEISIFEEQILLPGTLTYGWWKKTG